MKKGLSTIKEIIRNRGVHVGGVLFFIRPFCEIGLVLWFSSLILRFRVEKSSLMRIVYVLAMCLVVGLIGLRIYYRSKKPA